MLPTTSHHAYTHEEATDKELGYQPVSAWFTERSMEALAQFLAALAEVREGDGTLLDNSILFYGSGMSDSNLHLHKNLPITVVHGKNMGIQGNRHVRAKEGTPLANLQMTLLGKMGVGAEKFGDSQGELDLLAGI